MKEKINHVDDTAVYNGTSLIILKPPQPLLEVKPDSYYPKLVTIGPLYQNLEPSPIDNLKALCVKKFMERHSENTSAVEDLISVEPHELSRIYNLNLPQSDFEWLQLLVTIDTVFIHEFLFFSSTVRSYCQDKQHEFLHSFFNNKIKCNQEPIISTDYLYDFFNNDFKCNPVWRNLFLMRKPNSHVLSKEDCRVSKQKRSQCERSRDSIG